MIMLAAGMIVLLTASLCESALIEAELTWDEIDACLARIEAHVKAGRIVIA